MPAQKDSGNASGSVRSLPQPNKSNPITLDTIRDALPTDVLSKIVAISKRQAKLAEDPINNPDLADFAEALKRDAYVPDFFAHGRFDFAGDFSLPTSKKYSVSVFLFGDRKSYIYKISMYRKSRIGLSPKLVARYTRQYFDPERISLHEKIAEAEERAFYSVCAHVAKILADHRRPPLKSPTEVRYVRFDSEEEVKKTLSAGPLKTRVAELYSTPKSAQYIRERTVLREARSGL